jgi:hypothetical protein
MVEKDRAMTEHIQKWESMLNNPDLMMYRVNQEVWETREEYIERVKTMDTFYYRGLNYPIRGKFTVEDGAFIPLTRAECRNVLNLAFDDKNYLRKQLDYVKKNTDRLKPRIRTKIEKIKNDQQKVVLFKAQCCGYRWTNEVGNEPVTKPGTKPGGGGKGLLLDVEVY